jgi:hypothetical protein
VGSITRLGRTGPAACCRGRCSGAGRGSAGGVWQKTFSSPSDAPRDVNAGFHQVTKEFPHQEDVGFLQLVIVARKLAADGYEVSIRSPTGHLDTADQFNHLLTSKSLNSEGGTDDG